MSEAVTIIGAGIVGICCALSLQERGVKVRLIDRGVPGQEASFGNAGVISPWSIIPQAMPGIWRSIPKMLLSPNGPLSVKPTFWPKMIPWGLRFLTHSNETSARAISDAMETLCQPSVMLYRRHLEGTGHEDLVVDSWYVHAFRNANNASLRDLGFQIRQEKGAELELIGPEQIKQVEPALSPDFKAAVLIKGQARARAPGQIAEVLADKARAQGAEFIRAEITALKHDADAGGGWHLNTSNGPLMASKLILAAGVWSADLLKPLGLKMPLAAERGYHVEFADPGVTLNNSVMDVDAKIVASSMLGGVRVAGSSEFGAINAPADPRKEKLLAKQAHAMLPGINKNAMSTWMGRRPSFPDSLPALGPIARQPGLYAAFGHSHYGLMMAPKTGELIADIVAGVVPNTDLTPFEPLRF
ncbi:MAG: FAD-binding oxidoreductase [Paracoccaceae bacterium]